MLDSFFYRHDKLSGNNDQQGEQFVNYNSHLVPAWLAERVWWTRSQSSLLNIYFRLSGFQSSLLLIHFWYSLSNCFYCSKVWHRTYSISEALLWRSARRSSAPLQKLHRNHRSYVWTESLYGMIRISCLRKSFPVYREHTKPHTIMIIRLVLCSTNINFVLK